MTTRGAAWYLNDHDGANGPHSVEFLLERLALGEIGPDWYVWHEGWDSWKAISDVPEFLSRFNENNESEINLPEIIHVENLFVDHGVRPALKGLDLSVRKGEIFGFIGNNGAGKTTTIHSILGLLPVKSGSISMLGMEPVSQYRTVLQKVGYCPERDDPYEWLKLATLFEVGRRAFVRWDRAYCKELIARFDLDTSKAVKELSKGMAAKARLVMALAHRPECLILDEPTSGLDPGSRKELLEIISDVSRTSGVTTIFSSHNLLDVMGIATDIGIIDDGQMLFRSSMRNISKTRIFTSSQSIPLPGETFIVSRKIPAGGGTSAFLGDYFAPAVQSFLQSLDGGLYTLSSPTLEEIFLFLTEASRSGDRPS